MRVFRSFDEARGIRNPVVTTGSFDGVHIGHRTIINRLRMLAGKHNGESVLITFYPHPRKVLYPDTAGKDLMFINSQQEKLMLLEKAGVDNVIIIEFTREFSRITSEQFVKEFLSGMLEAKVIIVGFNHHFGFNKEGDYRQLWSLREKYNFEAEEIPEQEVEHETVSSTRIRKAISEGYIQRANAYLDHHYLIMGEPEPSPEWSLSTGLRFHSIRLEEDTKLLPSAGIYAITAETVAGSPKGMVVIGGADEVKTQVLLHIPDQPFHIEGKNITLLFQKKITGPVSIHEGALPVQRLQSACNEIDDLIY